jgi:hypothetical protein
MLLSSNPRSLLSRAVLLAILLACAGIHAARAQLDISISLSRRNYILYEPIVLTVTLTNNAGRDLVLEDSDGKQWFNVQVSTIDGRMLSPYDPDYKLHPLQLPAGQTLQRSMDIGPLFPIRDEGTIRVRANIYLADLDRFYESNYASFDLVDGRLMWRETVGVPGSQDLRQVSLLTHELPDRLLLYARIRDENGPVIYTTQSLGRLLLSGNEPQHLFDSKNNLHVIQEAKPGAFLYTCVSLDGARLTQKAYTRVGRSVPRLVKDAHGDVAVRGGQIQVAPATGVGAPTPQPRLSDRPADLPLAPQPDEPAAAPR